MFAVERNYIGGEFFAFFGKSPVFGLPQIFVRIFRFEYPFYVAVPVRSREGYEFSDRGRAAREDGVYLLHHIDVVHALVPGKRVTDVLEVPDGVFLPVHIVRTVAR